MATQIATRDFQNAFVPADESEEAADREALDLKIVSKAWEGVPLLWQCGTVR